MLQRVLVALDRSEYSETIFKQAIAIARANFSQLFLANILPPLSDSVSEEMYSLPEALETPEHAAMHQKYLQEIQTDEQVSLQHLRDYADRAREEGIEVEIKQTVGDVGRAICWLAAEWNADLVVLGDRNRTKGIEHAISNVSNYVLEHTNCSVLIVRV